MSCATPLKSIALLKPLVPFFFFLFTIFVSFGTIHSAINCNTEV